MGATSELLIEVGEELGVSKRFDSCDEKLEYYDRLSNPNYKIVLSEEERDIENLVNEIEDFTEKFCKEETYSYAESLVDDCDEAVERMNQVKNKSNLEFLIDRSMLARGLFMLKEVYSEGYYQLISSSRYERVA